MTFRLANIASRASLIDSGGGVHDLESLGGPVDPMGALADVEVLHRLAAEAERRDASGNLDDALTAGAVGPPVPRPRNCFAVGLNYADHIEETEREPPETPLVFTKFPSCLSGPASDVELRSDRADWEVELVVVIGAAGRDIHRDDAQHHIAGFTVGQDVSDRALQFAATPPHFDLGKSRDTYGPMGPVVVSFDSLDDPWDLAIRCEVNGDERQSSRTSKLIFDVPALIAYLSSICTLEPGDVVFTGTPDGVGAARTPPVFLRPHDVITSTIEGIGSMTNRCVR